MPVEQSEHFVTPVVALKVPGTQFVHVEKPAALLKVPEETRRLMYRVCRKSVDSFTLIAWQAGWCIFDESGVT